MRALGLDVGSKTIGIALVDEAGIAAHPHSVLARVGNSGDAVAIVALTKHHEQDERFTTAEAERVMIDADVSRAKRKEVIDQQAAALILQTWLDAYRNRTESR